jgi:alpha-mannosidase
MTREVRLINGIPRIDIIDELDRPLIREPEGIHFAFPFNIPDGKIRVNSPWAVVQPEKDQMKGACKNWFSVQRWIDISNENFGVTFAPIDAPLMEIGDIHADATVAGWVRELDPSQTIYSYVMNNYWETNYKAEQPGVTRFRYSILLHRKYEQYKADRFGTESSQPLLAVTVRKDSPVFGSLFSVEPDDIVVSLLKSSEDGKKFVIRIFNTSHQERTVKFNWKSFQPGKVYLSNLFEEQLKSIKNPLKIAGYGLMTILALVD